jgi:hypothetical protein
MCHEVLVTIQNFLKSSLEGLECNFKVFVWGFPKQRAFEKSVKNDGVREYLVVISTGKVALKSRLI